MAYANTNAEVGKIDVRAVDMERGREVIVRGFANHYPAFGIHLTTEEAAKLAVDLQNALAEPQKVAA